MGIVGRKTKATLDKKSKNIVDTNIKGRASRSISTQRRKAAGKQNTHLAHTNRAVGPHTGMG
jgi:hypothetical protein